VQDREKCACWQLTIQGTAYGPGGVVDPTVGYYYRRLPEPVMTGIYECNSKYVLSCVHDCPFVPRLPWHAQYGRWNFLRDTGGVHRIGWSPHYFLIYLFICVWGAKSILVCLIK
jgi:hypothetical protein